MQCVWFKDVNRNVVDCGWRRYRRSQPIQYWIERICAAHEVEERKGQYSATKGLMLYTIQVQIRAF